MSDTETCGAWVGRWRAGEIRGERGVCSWSFGIGQKPLWAVVLIACHDDVESSGHIFSPWIRYCHPTGLTTVFHDAAGLVGFDVKDAMKLAIVPEKLTVRSRSDDPGQIFRDTEEAHAAGVNCEKNAPNPTNCDIKFFATKELTAAWQQGRLEARRDLKPTKEGDVIE